jgi:hypothetical protein
VGSRLYVRNAEEAVCYELATVDSSRVAEIENAAPETSAK